MAFAKTGSAWLVTGRGDLERTVDAGNSWQNSSRELVGGFSQISFLDPEQGWAVSNSGTVWFTKDSGASWVPLGEIDYRTVVPKGGLIKDFAFTDRDNGWAADLSSVWRSFDGGKTWSRRFIQIDSVRQDISVGACWFIDGASCWVSSQKGRVFSSTDGGASWRELRLPGGSEGSFNGSYPSSAFVLDEYAAWVECSARATICATTNAGETWNELHTFDSARITSLFFLNEREGWVSTIHPDSENRKPVAMLGRTLDGGRNWVEFDSLPRDHFFDRIFFADANHGWVASYNSIYYTSDAGKTFTLVRRLED